jgi:predicted PurR-regulated permease PerM
MHTIGFTGALGGRIALTAFLIGLLFLSYRVLHLFLVPVAWGLILVYLTWPAYRRLRARFPSYGSVSALMLSALLTLVFVLPVLWILFMLQAELPAVYAQTTVLLTQGPEILPPGIVRIPWLGAELTRLLAMAADDPTALQHQILVWLKPLVNDSLQLVGDIGATAFKFGFAVITAFFLYRDGDRLLEQTRRVLLGLLGDRAESYLKAIGDTTRGVLYGLVLTALLQGTLAGLGYWVAGLDTPILLGVVTTFLALIPFGTPLAIALVCLWLFLVGEIWPAVGLAAWGTLVVGQIDNLFRPLVISSAARIPYILVLFAVLGGIAAFGLVGLFIGPIVIAILLAVWREWIAELTPRG